jgi:geranylgeranyl diphosphate synthase type II
VPDSPFDFERYLAAKREAVETFLDRVLPSPEAYPPTIHRAIRYSLFAGGKRIRPVLLLGAAEAVGGSSGDALPGAAAIEMIHTYSLIHDDLPAMDNDSLRRGRPTSHVVFGEAVAVLAGDALLTHAFQILAAASGTSVERRLQAISVLARAAGTEGLIGGQVVDLESQGKPAPTGTLEFIHRAKTGALMRAAAEMGAILGGGSASDRERLGGFGEEVGLAFQIVDDILDVVGDAVTLGKTAGKDRKAGKNTYSSIHGVEEARRLASEHVAAAIERVAAFGERGAPLRSLARRILERNS